MNLFTKRFGLVLAGVIGVGAVASLAMGASFALFTASGPTQTNTFSAGTVSLTDNSSADYQCQISNMEPGDSSNPYQDLVTEGGVTEPSSNDSPATVGNHSLPACTDSITYTGSEEAFVGVEISFTSSGPNGDALINSNCDVAADGSTQPAGCQAPTSPPGGATEFEIDLGPSQAHYYGNNDFTVNCTNGTTPVTPADPTGVTQSCTGYSGTGSAATPLLVGTANTGDTIQADFNYLLPLLAGNGYQGSGASVTITLVTVQYGNNNSGGQPISWS